MSDEIVGIAILDNSVRPRRLYMLHRCGDGRQFISDIPVYDYREPKPCEVAWAFRIPETPEGWAPHTIMHVTPSVHWRYQAPPDETWHTRFHNGGSWSVQFRYAVPPLSGREQVLAANGLESEAQPLGVA